MDQPTAACRRGRRDLQELLASPEPVTYWLSVIWLYTGEQEIIVIFDFVSPQLPSMMNQILTLVLQLSYYV